MHLPRLKMLLSDSFNCKYTVCTFHEDIFVALWYKWGKWLVYATLESFINAATVVKVATCTRL